MLTISHRVAATLAAGAILVGWISASLMVPPAAVSQSTAVTRASAATTSIPVLALHALTAHGHVRPHTARNPFAFSFARREAAPADRSSDLTGAVDDRAATATRADGAADPTAPAALGWRLVGVAYDEASGHTAIVSADGAVHLLRVGESLADATVDAVSATEITLRWASGRTAVLRLP